MTSVEEMLRAATESAAAEFTQADLSPLRLVGGFGEAGGAGGADRSWLRSRRGLAAFGATAALLAVLAGSLALAGYLRHHQGRSRPGQVAATVITSGPLAGIPRYFVELRRDQTGEERARRADVIDSATGRVLASIAVPAPYDRFAAVTAATDDRTFVLAAERWPARKNVFTPFHTKLFELRLGAGRSGRLTVHLAPLGLRIPVNWQGDGLALSPDGTSLALAASPWSSGLATRIWVYSMTRGTVRSWQGPIQLGRSPWDARCLSWSPDDRTVGYLAETGGDYYLLDTTSPGGTLASRSRKLITFSENFTPTFDADLTPGGQKVIAGMYVHSGGLIDEFSATTGRVITSITPGRPPRPSLYDVLWTNASGSLMLIELAAPLTRHQHQEGVVLLRGTKLTPVPHVGVHLSGDVAW